MYLDCIPCIVRQCIEAARFAEADAHAQECIVREVLRRAAETDWGEPPAHLAQFIHRRVRQLTGNTDPYAQAKQEQNEIAARYSEVYRQQIDRSKTPLKIAVQLAIAGNVIDLGVKSGLKSSQIESEIAHALEMPLVGDVEQFAEAVQAAQRILYLTDNAGEIVFDRLLIEQLPCERITVAVRGGPAINDATRTDAEYAGLTELVTVIDNGSDAPGTILDDCSKLFCEHFETADLIISKGQGNYETLRMSSRPIYFLLRVKCDVTARDIGVPIGQMVLLSQQTDECLTTR